MQTTDSSGAMMPGNDEATAVKHDPMAEKVEEHAGIVLNGSEEPDESFESIDANENVEMDSSNSNETTTTQSEFVEISHERNGVVITTTLDENSNIAAVRIEDNRENRQPLELEEQTVVDAPVLEDKSEDVVETVEEKETVVSDHSKEDAGLNEEQSAPAVHQEDSSKTSDESCAGEVSTEKADSRCSSTPSEPLNIVPTDVTATQQAPENPPEEKQSELPNAQVDCPVENQQPIDVPPPVLEPTVFVNDLPPASQADVVSESSPSDPAPSSTVVKATTTTEAMSTTSSPVDLRTQPPVAPPRRPSSAIQLSKKYSTSSYSSGKLFNTMPRRNFPPTQEDQQRKKKNSMLRWLGGDSSKKKSKEVLETVSEGLRKIYKQKLYPLEEHYKFHEFHSPALDDPDFDAKPMILLVGQYSTGKTTFIRHLLEKDFPGIRIGPEPTTDRFIAVMYGEEEGVIPGNALVVDAKKQFRALSGFGNAFLNRFQCSTLPNQVLESVTIVDTPGILSGEKQRIDRGYDFTGVLEWFAERVDRIILLFDAHKLDISDEFKRCIEALAGNEDKIRIVLNKSDMVDHQQLMRVYGALMWSLGKVFRTPEVSRVYIGSFWDQPLHYDINRRLFQDEQHDLFQDLQALPRNAALRKLNDLIKRARLAKVHAFIISELRKQMPSMIGKDKKKKELIQNLDKIFEQLQREHNISPGDFPDVHKMREKLQNQDFTKFNPLKPKLLDVVDGMLATDIARLMAQIPKEEQSVVTNGGAFEQPTVRGGAFTQAQEAETPFGFGRGEGFDKGADESEWIVSRERTQADSTFESLGPVGGFISGRAAKDHMVKSKLPNAVLGKIWKLADVDKDGQLDADEFALANYLINLKLEGHELPADLPSHLVPPSKRGQETVYPTLDEE